MAYAEGGVEGSVVVLKKEQKNILIEKFDQ